MEAVEEGCNRLEIQKCEKEEIEENIGLVDDCNVAQLYHQ